MSGCPFQASAEECYASMRTATALKREGKEDEAEAVLDAALAKIREDWKRLSPLLRAD